MIIHNIFALFCRFVKNIHNFVLKKEKPLIYVVNENEKEFVHA